MRPVKRRYLLEFLPAMAAYVAVLFVSVWLLKSLQALAPRALVALLPMLPLVLAARAIIRFVRDSDELERRIELEAVAIASLLVTQGYFAAGLLQSAGLIQVQAVQALFWAFPLLCLVYGLVKLLVLRRYR